VHLGPATVSGLIGRLELVFTDRPMNPCGHTAVPVSLDDQPAHPAAADPWPRFEPDGTLIVPARPLPGRALRINTTPQLPGVLIEVTVDLASWRLPCYQATRRLGIEPPDPPVV